VGTPGGGGAGVTGGVCCGSVCGGGVCWAADTSAHAPAKSSITTSHRVGDLMEHLRDEIGTALIDNRALNGRM
jgi:hypothetical protein